jgi:hypothetical protein
VAETVGLMRRPELGHSTRKSSLGEAVQALTRGDKGGVLQPEDACTKTGRPVLEVLREKHPQMKVQDLAAADRSNFEPYDCIPQPLPVEITVDVVETVAARLSGAAGPGGTDAVDLRNWLLRFGAESEGLGRVMAKLTEWIANERPPWAAIRALMACRLVALDKSPGVRPVGIGEIYRRLMAKCLLKVVGHQATTACGNLNLCAGLPAGIEGAVHAMRETWDSFELEEQSTEEEPTTKAMEGDGREGNPEGGIATNQEPKAMLQVDARNGFNELSRQAMLWTVRHRWAAGSRFGFNCYRHSAQLILRSKGNEAYVILSNEGVTQGDPLSMVLYGLALLPLAELLREQEPTVVQPWYADDTAMAGTVSGIARAMTLLQHHGPQRGYYPVPAKSILICKPNEMERAKEVLKDFEFQYHAGYRYVGGFVGTAATESAWLEPKIQAWVRGIESLARVAKRYPQTAYASLTKFHQPEWQYLQRVTPASTELFQPLEDSIQATFIPALLGEEEGPTDAKRRLYELTVKSAGLGIPNPTNTAPDCHAASAACSGELSASLRGNADLDVKAHRDVVKQARRKQMKIRCNREKTVLDSIIQGASRMEARRLQRTTGTGTWLTAVPDRLNGTELSPLEFRDSIRMRCGLTPANLPAVCDGCQQPFTVDHAVTCKKGGLIVLRHNDVKSEWHELCAKATTPSAVSDEPLIHLGQAPVTVNATSATEVPPELRGDVAVRGFWSRGTTAVFDIRITDTDASAYWGQATDKILLKHEKEKKTRYLQACLDQRRHFTPLVFSVDGVLGSEAKAASKRLAARLSAKWKRPYSEVCGFVRSRLSVALVRSMSTCLRGARDPAANNAARATWDSGTGLALYRQ